MAGMPASHSVYCLFDNDNNLRKIGSTANEYERYDGDNTGMYVLVHFDAISAESDAKPVQIWVEFVGTVVDDPSIPFEQRHFF